MPVVVSLLSEKVACSVGDAAREVRFTTNPEMTAVNRDVELPANTASPEGHVGRPWWMWCIGVIDLISAVFHAGLAVYYAYQILTKSHLDDPGQLVLEFFLELLAVAGRLLQGLAIAAGLKSKDDSNALWYCKFWCYFQIAFLLVSIVQLIFYGVTFRLESLEESEQATLAEAVILFLHRITSIVLVAMYMNKLRSSLATEPGFIECREFVSGVKEMDDAQRVRENAVCEPTMALLLSM